jgi:hypothetical protein
MTPLQKDTAVALRRRYARLATRLAKLGLVLQGTITERMIVRQDPAETKKQKNYGPYYQWTCKRQGKTVTINLTHAQAKIYQRAINEHRKLEHILDEMRALSSTILETTTRGVQKRKP